MALLLGLALAAGCGKTDDTLSGETHFITCSADQDCSRAASVATCQGGFCRDENGDKIAASADSDVRNACASCGDSGCAAPGSCTLTAACKLVDCGGVLVDDDACVRPECQSDGDCPDDERCTSEYWSREYGCEQSGESCDCQSGKGLFPIHVCSPTRLAGERGDWQKLVIDDIVIAQSTKRTFLPDGSVTIEGKDEGGNPTSSTKTLSSTDFDQLERTVNGHLLRPALAVDPSCPVTKSKDVIVELVLDSRTLEQNVAGCVTADGEVAVFKDLYELATRY